MHNPIEKQVFHARDANTSDWQHGTNRGLSRLDQEFINELINFWIFFSPSASAQSFVYGVGFRPMHDAHEHSHGLELGSDTPALQ